MSKERFFIADPYNDDHLKLISSFEKTHGIMTATSAYLQSVRQKETEKEYESGEKENNDITQSLFLECDGTITDVCHIQGEKDIKTCQIFFAPINTKNHTRKLVTLATDYAFNVLGMEEVFIPTQVDENNRSLISTLEEKGFENLGEDGNTIIYLKEKELEVEDTRHHSIAA